jgi:regulator of sigma E protease
MGFGLVPHPDGRLTLTGILAGSSAERVGLREGDLLAEFDGTAAADMSPRVTRAAAERGTPVKIVVVRDGRRVELVVEPFVERSR